MAGFENHIASLLQLEQMGRNRLLNEKKNRGSGGPAGGFTGAHTVLKRLHFRFLFVEHDNYTPFGKSILRNGILVVGTWYFYGNSILYKVQLFHQ